MNNDPQPSSQPEPHPEAPAQPAEAEQIGPLMFVANADYPYPFEVETPPRFWMEETTGALGNAVDAYMDGEKLSPDQLSLIDQVSKADKPIRTEEDEEPVIEELRPDDDDLRLDAATIWFVPGEPCLTRAFVRPWLL